MKMEKDKPNQVEIEIDALKANNAFLETALRNAAEALFKGSQALQHFVVGSEARKLQAAVDKAHGTIAEALRSIKRGGLDESRPWHDFGDLKVRLDKDKADGRFMGVTIERKDGTLHTFFNALGARKLARLIHDEGGGWE